MNKKSGYVILLFTVLFSAIALIMIIGVSNPVISHYWSVQAFSRSNQAYTGANAAIFEAIYRLNKGWNMGASETFNLQNVTGSIAVTPVGTQKAVVASVSANGFQRTLRADLALGTGISFHYGIQGGHGGFLLQNTSSVTGNIFSEGSIIGTGSSANCNGSPGKGNCIYGDVISAGPDGLVYAIHSTSTVYAHTIGNASLETTIDKDAHYANKVGTVNVSGTLHPGSADQPVAALPISDAQINQWENDALVGGEECPGENGLIKNDDVVLGPKKITCDLDIKDSTVTVKGPIWVTGNITVEIGSVVKMSPDLGSQNVAFIADNPNNRTGSGIITLQNGATFEGSGSAGSFVFMISQNNCAETNCTPAVDALSMSQGASALVGYAIHGQITLSQSTSVKEITAYKIILTQSANVTYDTGLPSTVFQSGPSGGYNLIDWYEL